MRNRFLSIHVLANREHSIDVVGRVGNLIFPTNALHLAAGSDFLQYFDDLGFSVSRLFNCRSPLGSLRRRTPNEHETNLENVYTSLTHGLVFVAKMTSTTFKQDKSVSFMNWMRIAVAVLCTFVASYSFGAIAQQQTKVFRTLIDDTLFGQCMILVEAVPAELNCGTWVSASCSGDFNPSNVGWRKLEVAQMAQALRRKVVVHLDDSRKHNGWCFVTRIQLIDAPAG